jgi:hypothetical protein
MELYTAGTGNGQRAAIAVNECGVSCEIHVLNRGQGDQKAADYLKINPTARIRAVTIERIGVDRDRTLARIEWTTGHATFYPGQSIR